MRRGKQISLTLVVFALCLLAESVSAQSYSIDWHTIDGGGGASTGGAFAIRGTIGQPDAGTVNGGIFSLAAGFWPGIETTGAPPLTIRLTPTNAVVISWPSPSPSFVLRQNESLNTSNWIAPSEAITDNGADKFILVQPPTGNRFYRLVKP